MGATSSCRPISAASRAPSRHSPTRSDRRRGRGIFDRFLDLLGRGEGTPSQARVDQAVALIKP
jgi:hypothetical protein